MLTLHCVTKNCSRLNTGWAKIQTLRLIAHISKLPEPICVTFDTLQCRLVLNTSIKCIFVVKFITQRDAAWRKPTTRLSISTNFTGICAYDVEQKQSGQAAELSLQYLCIERLDVCGLLERRQTSNSLLTGDLISGKAWRKLWHA